MGRTTVQLFAETAGALAQGYIDKTFNAAGFIFRFGSKSNRFSVLKQAGFVTGEGCGAAQITLVLPGSRSRMADDPDHDELSNSLKSPVRIFEVGTSKVLFAESTPAMRLFSRSPNRKILFLITGPPSVAPNWFW